MAQNDLSTGSMEGNKNIWRDTSDFDYDGKQQQQKKLPLGKIYTMFTKMQSKIKWNK